MSTEVRQMFSSIATRYDVTNEVLSLGIHRLWRRAAVRHSGAKEGNRVLYSIADPAVFELCEHVCGGLRRQVEGLDALIPGGK